LQLGETNKMAKAKKETKKETAAATASTATSAPVAGTAPAGPGTDLTIADLKNLATIIDVASTRGAFRANEMATVGVMFNKLSAFLAKVAPADKPAEQAEATAPAGK
jgi:hypothetical protein